MKSRRCRASPLAGERIAGLQTRRLSRFPSRSIYRSDRKHIPDTSAELALQIDRGKCPAMLCEVGRRSIDRYLLSFKRSFDRFMRNVQK